MAASPRYRGFFQFLEVVEALHLSTDTLSETISAAKRVCGTVKMYNSVEKIRAVGLEMLGAVLSHAYEENIPGLDAMVRESEALEVMVDAMVCVEYLLL